MKNRYGFVSNSSSSSFIVGLKSMPKNCSELRDMWMGKRDDFEDACPRCLCQEVWEALDSCLGEDEVDIVVDVMADNIKEEVLAGKCEDDLKCFEVANNNANACLLRVRIPYSHRLMPSMSELSEVLPNTGHMW